MSVATILMVDDEYEIIKLMEIYFKNENYTMLKAGNGIEALELLEKHQVDLIVLDVMMPSMDGIEACMKIREKNHIPIIMLSAKSQDMDKISGLSVGADDYVTKPFSPLELIARIKAQLRRVNQFHSVRKANDHEIRIDNLVINSASHVVTLDDKIVKLTPREFAILLLLANHAGKVLSMDQIYEHVWQEPFMESKNTVMVHIRKLREKLEDDPQKPYFIKTVWGIGYKLENHGQVNANE
ncbi:DNA-binding response regulator [Paenibacillus montaniterrae]|uniref:DNA-binding response regulator n=1 Tax=Paenibacillus montaniterrae TaxID=429341 RepID=A0A920CVY8_9BACL|nr:response regulator transcription factor [Paenibacillus montaniterrae]GIP14660.1 DNA-binding response regulator [Paenibacillus montaniterrae]